MPLALALLGNFLRIHFPGPVTDGLFFLLILLLGLLLFRDGAFGQFAPSKDGAARRSGASLAAVRLTCWCFAALMALYAIGLAFEFSLKGFRHFAGLLIGALLFLFCYWNGSALVRSKAVALLFLGAVAALLSLYLTPGSLNPNGFSLILGCSLLAIALVLMARSEQPRRQQLWACAGLALVIVCGVAYGNRSLALTALLGFLAYWGSGFLLRGWRGVGLLTLAAGALIALAVALLGTSRFADLRSNLEAFARHYTGSGLQSGREIFFRIALAGIAQSPWFGNGPGAEITPLAPQGGSGSAPAGLGAGGKLSCFDSGNSALAADCELLLKLRNDLAGDSERLWTWNFHTPIDKWKGIKLAGEPTRVTGIELPHNSLTGRIPPELGGLDQLISLRLSFNMLAGAIPPELGQLSNLRTLALDANALSGAIPPELAELSNLTELHLSNNRLSGAVPAALADLGNLSIIRLANNDFVGAFPAALQQLHPHLIRVPRCQRSSAIGPGLLADCTKLLAARDALAGDGALNWSSAIPIAHWQGVKLQGAPPRVIGLELYGPGLRERLPPQLGELDQLAFLQLNGSEFSGAMLSFLRPANGHDLDADSFCLPLPQVDAGLLKDCAALLAARDALAGGASLNWNEQTPIPLWQGLTLGFPGGQPRVVGLELPEMGLNGRIPPELGALERLVSLQLSDNRLTGAIPRELGGLAHLAELRLARNALSGAVPPALGQLPRLTLVRLSGNAALGAIPAKLRLLDDQDLDAGPFCKADARIGPGLLRDCQLLLAARDALAGSAFQLNWRRAAPLAFWRGVALGGAPARVVALDLSRLGLNGAIPSELGGLDQLVSLRLHRNALVGPIPSSLGELAKVQELALNGNVLTGAIPPQLGSLSQLRSLHLRRNRLSGAIPQALGKLAKLQVLTLDGNALAGTVPSQLGDLEELRLGNGPTNEAPGAVPAPANPAPLAGAESGDSPVLAEPLGTAGSSLALERDSQGAALFCRPALEAAHGPLLEDCRTLLSIQEELAGEAQLNWREELAIPFWQGVALAGDPLRIAGLELPQMGLNGRLPQPLARLDQLAALRLNGNRLGGPVPRELSQLRNLRSLALGGNQFAGCLPKTLRETGDRELELDLLCGPSPWSKPALIEDAALLMGIREALAGGASLNWSYDIPIWQWQGVALDVGRERVIALDLSGMGLQGRIPPALGALDGLLRLRLSDNQLAGAVPPQLGNLFRLQELALDGNALTGPIPEEWGNLPWLAKLWLAGNQFAGPLPRKLCYLERFLEPLPAVPPCWRQPERGIGDAVKRLNLFLNPAPEEGIARTAHNLFLQMGLQTGIAGIALASLLCASLFFNLRSRLGGKVAPARRFVAACVFLVVVHGAFEVFLLQGETRVGALAWMLIGMGTGAVRSGQLSQFLPAARSASQQ